MRRIVVSHAARSPYQRKASQLAVQMMSAAAASEGNVTNEIASGVATGPGGSVWTDYTLSTGNYIAVCNIPDVASGTPHAVLGMVGSFAVTEGAAPATMPATGASTPLALTLLGWSAVAFLAGLTVRAAYIRTR